MRFFVLFFVFSITLPLHAQFPESQSSAALYHQLQKSIQPMSVLYIAAHPDDENTRLISYLENHLLARTAYISLTRGDGGQNLIGTEIGAAVGVLRTQELLSARRIDGGEQFFTRAVDFGYSKSSDETLENWGKDEILGDLVWVIRKFRPDVLITRFPPSNYAGHGHHEASALLAEEAFDAAADQKAYPEQLKFVQTWQPKRLYFNVSSWWNKDLVEQAKGNSDFITLNVGQYNKYLGESYAQIAARSRSEHKSQGFGSDYVYGLNVEYLQYVKGEKADPQVGILDGVSSDWTKFQAVDAGKLLTEELSKFDFGNPQNSIPRMVDALKALREAPDSPLKAYKIKELEALCISLAGIQIEATSDHILYAPGDQLTTRLAIINNSDIPVKLQTGQLGETATTFNISLKEGELFSNELSMQIPTDAQTSNPYWLREPYTGRYQVEDFAERGLPENPAAFSVRVKLEVLDYAFEIQIPVKHKLVDPVKAVVYSPVYIVPQATFNFSEKGLVVTGSEPQRVVFTVQNNSGELNGRVKLVLPKGWTQTPEYTDLAIKNRGASLRIEVSIAPSSIAESGTIYVDFRQENSSSPTPHPQSLQLISYDHIPAQIILTDAKINLELMSLNRGQISLIGYIDGPGDDVAKYLRVAGYHVESISSSDLQSSDLSRFDAIISGIRAYNTRTDLRFANDVLNRYVAAGGTYVVQYNTSRGLEAEEFGPFPFTITRERVTDEEAEPRFINPKHPIFHSPNILTINDFSGWVQERGLYFAADWDPAFEPLISWSDPGEPERKGALIVASHGKGHFVYTGISFFRQLPAGVPGAYRLLANILALSQNGDKLDD